MLEVTVGAPVPSGGTGSVSFEGATGEESTGDVETGVEGTGWGDVVTVGEMAKSPQAKTRIANNPAAKSGVSL